MDSFLHDRLLVYRSFYGKTNADRIFEALKTGIDWLSPNYTNEDGGTVHLPRLTANYGEKSYDYSGLIFQPKPWNDLLLSLKNDAERLANQSFNALVLQWYRDGNDKVNWHSDDAPGVGRNPVIVSISFGETRGFWFKSKDPALASDIFKIELLHGDVVIMRGDLQHTHVHKVPTEKDKGGRINLTFREIVEEVNL